MTVRRAIGIDLGTTHSLVAYVDDRNRPQVLPVDGASVLLPSAVRYRDDGTVEVGARARDEAPLHPEETLLSVKRWMGRAPRDLTARDRGIYRFEEESPLVRIRVAPGARSVTPVEVSAEILRVLRRRGEQELGPLGGCVVTVPAYFDDAQRQATRDAARLAGLDLLRLLNEPTAAALAYGLDHRTQGVFAIFDLGGGTFDLSILRLASGTFEVLATAGDTHLGGDDFDRAVAQALLERGGIAASPLRLRAALATGRQVREALSSAPEWGGTVRLPDGATMDASLRREELEALIRPIVERTTAACERARRDAGVPRIDGVVLVGGATRTPLVRRHVRHLFGQEPLTDLDPDRVVALGAAVQADALEKGGRDDVLLLDVLPLSVGVEMMGGVVEKILFRNSTIPASATQQFTTHADGQTGLVVHVVQGERERASDCRSLARFTLKGIPPLPAGAARVEITYRVDANGILSVSARELATGVEQRIQVKATYGLSEEDVERMLVESLEHGADDVERRLLAEWKLEGQRLLDALDHALGVDAELVGADERCAIEDRIQGLRQALEGEDPHALRAWIDAVDEASRAFAERRLDKHVGHALAGRRLEDV